MDKEEKVDMLTEVVAEKAETHDGPCSVLFFFADEVQMLETWNGSIPMNKIYSRKPLKTVLRKVVKCYYTEEENIGWNRSPPNARNCRTMWSDTTTGTLSQPRVSFALCLESIDHR